MKNIFTLLGIMLCLPLAAQIDTNTTIPRFDVKSPNILFKDNSFLKAKPFGTKNGMLVVELDDTDITSKYNSKYLLIPIENLAGIYEPATKQTKIEDYAINKLPEINNHYITKLQLKGSNFSVTGLALGLAGPTIFGLIAAALPADSKPGPRIGLSAVGGLLGIVGYSLNLSGHIKMKKSYQLKDIQVIDY